MAKHTPIYYERVPTYLPDGSVNKEMEPYRDFVLAAEKCRGDLAAYLEKGRDTAALGEIIDAHGLEMVKYVLATNIREGYVNAKDRTDIAEWAEGIRISSDSMDRYDVLFDVETDSDEIFALASDVMRMKGAVNKKTPEKTEAPVKDDIDLTDDEAETLSNIFGVRVNKKNQNVAIGSDGSVVVTMPKDALIHTYPYAALLAMPRCGEYAGYKCLLTVKNFFPQEDGTIIARMTNRGLRPEREDVGLTVKGHGRAVRLSPYEISEYFARAKEEDYKPVMYDFEIPSSSITGEYDETYRCKFPAESGFGQKKLYHLIAKEYESESGSTTDTKRFSVPDYATFTIKDREGNETVLYASDMQKEVNAWKHVKTEDSSDAETVKPVETPTKKPIETPARRVGWTETKIDKAAYLKTFDKTTMFKMPETGEYAGYVYYVPNGMIVNFGQASFDGQDYDCRFPETKVFSVRRGDDKKDINLEEYLKAVEGKNSADYARKASARESLPVRENPAEQPLGEARSM